MLIENIIFRLQILSSGAMSRNSSSLGPLLEDPSTAPRAHNVPALVFGVALIVTITGGNVLVCVSVYLEKALKTSTNYFIITCGHCLISIWS
uniref:G-protein coupled receptors family 1 profile domain-containing protein n=1 Tax=Periophthalmus magnuspinnatus TaxID=409849 RepID=A0A3B4B3J9_9GOBI